MFQTLTDYNDRNNTSLSYSKIWESIRKFMEDESIADANSVTAETFSHTSNTQIENANVIFTSETLDKSDELVDVGNILTIKDAKYHESNTATASDVQGDLTQNLETESYLH